MEKYKARANDHRVKKDKSDNKKQSGEKMFGVCYALIVHGRVPRCTFVLKPKFICTPLFQNSSAMFDVV